MADLTTDSADSNDNRILGLFAKAWDAGSVKTRLAATLGDRVAAEIYQHLLAVNLLRFARSADFRVVAYSPVGDETKRRFEDFMSAMKPAPQWDLAPQSGGDLGTRMSSFFQQQFRSHANGARVVLIGSDALHLSCDMMDEAFELLESHDAVFGPSTDGGYYLVGLSLLNTGIFEGIDWSTERVLEQSLEKCESSGLSVAQLGPLTDIDTEEDLRQEVSKLQSMDPIGLEVGLQGFLSYMNNLRG